MIPIKNFFNLKELHKPENRIAWPIGFLSKLCVLGREIVQNALIHSALHRKSIRIKPVFSALGEKWK
jgi:hypothetical protein